MRASSLPILLLVLAAAGCSPTPLTKAGGTGGSAYMPGTGGADLPDGGGGPCGPVTCGAGTYCCNAGCGICAAPGSACVAGCPTAVDGGAAVVDAGALADGGPVTCADLQSLYAAALSAALSCTPGAGGQCTKLVSQELSTLRCPGFPCAGTYVNDDSALAAIAAVWSPACTYDSACPQIACGSPDPGTCLPLGDGGGECVSLVPHP
jgi:hypothetical protein